MKDYKDTLKLPQTAFPMKAELAKREPAMLARWEAEQLYEQVQAARLAAPKFILHDGPPYANGNIHVGHASNKILKDIILKAKRLSGLQAPFTPGWDCHGLPIEHQVEKKFGKVGPKQSAAEFREKCRSYAHSQVMQQRLDFERLGVLADWQHPYITMDNSYEADTIRTLARIYQQGHIKKGYKPIHWCLDCGSSLAEAEVEYQDKTSDAITVKFKVLDENFRDARLGETYVLIWTTTPWTLPANQAVAAGPDIDYVLVASEGVGYWVAESLHEALFKDLEHQVLKRITGKALEGISLQHPFYDKVVPMILGDHVTIDAGTGFVHTAPAHGVEDYQVCQKYGIAVERTLGSNGCFAEDVPLFAGIHVSKANPLVLEALLNKQSLFKHDKLQHSYPHCWRHKTPLIFRATPQWFIRMDQLLNEVEQAALAVNFTPPEGKTRFLSMLQGRPDWCISRQRYWGVPIPFFIHKVSGELHPDTAKLMAEVAERIEKEGLEAWFGASPEAYGVASEDYDKLNDILDVWFDSGASSQCVVNHQHDFSALTYPADLYLEGSDQHRGWFQTSLLTALAAGAAVPFKQILTHGFVVDGQGRKMSKSLGNVITPQEVINQYGADILRLWVAMCDYRGEMTISPTILQQTADLYRKLRNTLRFLLANLDDFNPTQLLPMCALTELDRFMINKALDLQNQGQTALHAYQINTMVKALNQFCEAELSNCYFDVIKDRQYTSQARVLSQTALYHILHILVRLMAPILSFTADEVWQLMREKKLLAASDQKSIFTEIWYDRVSIIEPEYLDEVLFIELKIYRAGISRILDALRKNKEIGSNLDVEITLFTENPATLNILAPELKFFFISSDFKIAALRDAPIEAEALEDINAKVLIQKSTHKKCVRCWLHSEDVGQKDPLEDPELCNRCYDNVYGAGETRKFF